MIGFIGTLVTILLIALKYSAIADLHNFHFTVAQALGFSVSTSRLLANDPNTETITSNHYKDFLPFIIQLSWAADSTELDRILRFYRQPITSLSSLDSVLICIQLLRKQFSRLWCRVVPV
jgi:hypothetical protein